MAVNALETSFQAEGSDELKEFLLKYKTALKNSLTPIYDTLIKADLDKDELLEFDSVDLRKTLESEGLDAKHIGRLVRTLRKISTSQIYAESQTKSVVVLSSQEEKALNDITAKTKQFKQTMTQMTNKINEFTACYKTNETVINNEFDEIINTANVRRKNLLEILTTVTDEHIEQLTQQMNNLKQYNKQMLNCYDNAQAMIQNTSYDSQKRKEKILSTTCDILKNAKPWNIFKLPQTVIKVMIDSTTALETLSSLGDAKTGVLPTAPVITVQTVKATAVKLNVMNEENVIGYKLQYAEFSGDIKEDYDSDEMKIEWQNIEVETCDKHVEYTIGLLKKNTKYIISARSKNTFGYGNRSEIVNVQTKKPMKKPKRGKGKKLKTYEDIDFGSKKKAPVLMTTTSL